MQALQRNILWLLGAVAVLAAGYYFSDILSYLLIAWVLSMLGRPLMVFYQRKLRIRRFHVGPTGASLLTILTFYLIIIGILLVFVPTIVSQARNLAGVDYQALGEKLKVPFQDMDVRLHSTGLLHPNESLGNKTQEILSNWFKPTLVGDFLGSFLGAAGSVLVTISSVTFILFFFLKENTLFMQILHAFVPNELEPKVRHAVQESSEVLTRYFGGLVTQVAIFALSVTTVLWLLGVKNALLIGAFGGIFNVIPYIGPILGIVFGWFITISSHLDMEFALLLPILIKVAACFFGVQMIDNTFVGPMIFSKSVEAHPLEIFIVTLVAAKIGGVAGMVLGIPVYTVLRVIARVFFSEFKVVQRLTEHLDE
jgi:predicted PurR-regulated permease PerM